MEVRRDSKAQRSLEALAVRAKAPVAAHVEDCLQAFARLSAVLRCTRPQPDGLYKVMDDSLGRLVSWGRESGASSMELDHSLRFSSKLKDTTLEFLSDLNNVLQEANEALTLAEHTKDPPDGDSNLDISDDSSEAFDLDQCVEDTAEIVLCLIHLLPSLLNPMPYGLDHAKSFEEDVLLAKKSASLLFPKAPLFLVERLGIAACKRRQQLKVINQRVKTGSTSPQRKSLEKRKKPFRAAKSVKSVAGWVSEAGISRVASTAFTRFTDFTRTTQATSVADTEAAEYLQPPDPPQALDSSRAFICPFCAMEITPGDHIKKTEDWNRHVYLDFEPYLCTFPNCESFHKTYGNKEEWFQHELEAHRLQEVWFCGMPSCRRYFDTVDAFKEHVRTVHEDISSYQLTILAETCKRWSQELPSQLPCTLCGSTCISAESLKEHLAHHLEQFALHTALDEGFSETEDMSDDDDQPLQEISPANSLLDDFLVEQGERVGLSEQNVHRMADSRKAHEPLVAVGLQSLRKDREGSVATNGTSNIARGDPEDDRVRTEMSSTQTVRSNGPTPNVAFVGRQRELASIHKILSRHGSICVVRGCGGVGKTSIATEYSYQFENEYEYVFWVEAETAGGCAESYNLIAKIFKLGDRIRDSDGLAILTREYLARLEKRWLLIFDNVEAWSNIKRYIPSNLVRSRAAVLVTTREAGIVPGEVEKCGHVSMEALTLEESRSMLLQSIQPNTISHGLKSHEDYDCAGEAAKLVERLPLAISMVAGFLKVSSCSLPEFLDIWDDITSANVSDKSPIDIMREIGMHELSLPARRVLEILSFLDPDMVPQDIFIGDHKEPEVQFLNSVQRVRYQRMIDQLCGRSLVRLSDKGGHRVLSMHRVLQHKIKTGLDKESLQDAFERAVILICKKYPTASVVQVPDCPDWEGCRRYTPHVLSIHRIFKDMKVLKPSFELARLFYDAGFGVWACHTATSDGIRLLETAEEILNSLDQDPDHKLRADICSTLGNLLELQGTSNMEERFRRQREARRIREKIVQDDPNYDNTIALPPTNDDLKANSILRQNATNDYAMSLLDKNQFEEAGEIFDECFKIYRGWYGEEVIPFEYARYHHNKGLVLMSRGDYAEAIEFVQHAVKLTDGFSGKGWRYWQFQFTLACILLQSGDLQAALDMHLEVHSGRLELYGKYDRSTNMSKYAVAAMYHHIGDLQTALDYMRECVEYSAISNCPEESLARARFHLARLCKEQGVDKDEAITLEQEAMTVLSRYPTSFPGDDDVMILFDDLQPVCGGRFTGLELLRTLQESWGS